MALSPQERHTLERIERELSGDPGVDRALRSMDGTVDWRAIAGGGAIAVGLMATFALLMVSFIASFVGFVLLLIGLDTFAPRAVQWVLRKFDADAPTERASDG